MKKFTFTFITILLFAVTVCAQDNNVREYTIRQYTEYIPQKDSVEKKKTKKEESQKEEAKKEKTKKEKTKKEKTVKEKTKKEKAKKEETPKNDVVEHESAEDKEPKVLEHLSIEGRIAYEYATYDGTAINRNTGFKGQYVYLNVGGNFLDKFTYNYRQRLDNISTVSFFDATEELNLTWDALPILHISGGKQRLALGGFEYQTPPIDLYYNSEFWHQFYPLQSQFGGTISVDATKYDNFGVQLTNSPFQTTQLGNIYCLSFFWISHHGFYSSRWSYNVMQSKAYQGAPKQYTNYIVLGHRFDITPYLYITLDMMNRATLHGIPSGIFKIPIGNDYSVASEISVRPLKNMRTYVKYTRDVNNDNVDDNFITVGTGMNTASVGIEYDAVKHKMGGVRVFANGLYNWGNTDNKEAEHNGKEIRVQVGAKISLDLLGAF